MLEMDRDRVSFAELLRPPDGYQISFAVGTTYSLDLKALLGLCIPLGLGFDPESLETINPVSLFAALQKLQGKLAIFCDKGGIKAGIADMHRIDESTGLFMLLEGMIHQVQVDKNRRDALSSFHPKVWVAKYSSDTDAEPLYRLVVMSRNLTFDTSWDIAVSLDGRRGKQNDCSNHLAGFLELLVSEKSPLDAERERRRKGSHTSSIETLAKEIRNVEFSIDSKYFDSVDFLPFAPSRLGLSSVFDASDSQLVSWRYKNLLVVSPFLSDAEQSPLAVFQDNRVGQKGRFVLLSREDSLARMNPILREKYECYCPVLALSDAELDGEGGANAVDYSDLHAKIYFAEDASSNRALYIGSLNASSNGVNNNVEAMLRLSVKRNRLTFASMLKVLIGSGGSDKAPFELFLPDEAAESEERDSERRLQRAFRLAARKVNFKSAKVRLEEGEERASISLDLDLGCASKDCEELSLSLRPLLSSCDGERLHISSKRGSKSIVFSGLYLRQVSALFLLCGQGPDGFEARCVLVCPRGKFEDSRLTLEERSRELLGVILSNHDGALALYISHAFDLFSVSTSVMGEQTRKEPGQLGSYGLVPKGLYERLLDLADVNPNAFGRARDLMSLIPNEVNQGEQAELDRLHSMIKAFAKAVK